MKKYLALLNTPTTKNVIINTLGNFLVIIFTAIYYYIMIRLLTKTEYGIVSVLFGIAFVLTNMLDFGITASIYAILPTFDKEKTHQKLSFIKSNLIFQTVCSAIVVGTFFIFSDYLDKNFFKLGVSKWLYFWALLSIQAFLIQNFMTNILMATHQVMLNNLLINIANTIKSVILIYLLFTGHTGLELIVIVLGILGPAIMFFGLLIAKPKSLLQFLQVPIDKAHLHLSYSISYFISAQIFNLGTRIDLFLLSYFLAKDQVGEYAAAQKIILVVISAVISITQVLASHFSNAKSKVELTKLLKKSMLYMMIPIGAYVAAIFLPESIYLAFFQSQYEKTGLITRLLSLSFSLYCVLAVLQLFFTYTIRKTHYLIITNAVFLIIMTIGCYFLIPIYGIIGPVSVYMIAFSTITIMSIYYFKKEFDLLPQS